MIEDITKKENEFIKKFIEKSSATSSKESIEPREKEKDHRQKDR